MDKQAGTPSTLFESGPELDAAVARVVMRWTSLGAHLWQDAAGTVYYTGHDPQRVFVPHVVFRPSSDALHVAWVEAQIERLGMWQVYLDALIHELRLEEHTMNEAVATGYPAPEDARVIQHVFVHASPAQRCRAAVAAVEHAAQ
jgi:hypothetical protein